MGKLHQAVGTSRAEHVANIISAGSMWAGYETLHHNVFSEANLQKYCVVNAEGKVIENSADKSLLVHNANGTVRHEDFLVIMDKIIEVRRRELTGITDLKNAGLTMTASIGDQLIGFENINEFQAAIQEMNPGSFDNNDTVFTEDFVPNPITHSSFQVPWRQQGFAYKSSLGMSESLRQVAERLEETLFNGNSAIDVTFNATSFPIFGYTTHPNRGTDTIGDWTIPANSELIVTDTVTAIGLMFADQGGVGNDSLVLYVANDIWTNLQNDFKANSDKTIMQRLMEISQIKEVKPGEKLAAGSAVLVEMLERTVQLGIAQDMIVVPHVKTNPMAPQDLTAYAAMVQHIKKDSVGNTGIMHLTP